MTQTQTTPLTAEEEAAAALAIEAGVLAAHALAEGSRVDATRDELLVLVRQGELAQEFLLTAHRRVIRYLVSHERRGLGSRADLDQEAWLAMTEALQRFDYRRGRFLTYAMTAVKSAVRAAVARENGLSERQARGLRQIREIESVLTQKLGRVPRSGEVAAFLERDPRWLAWCGVRESATSPELLNELPAQQAEHESDRGRLPDHLSAHRLVVALPPGERVVITGRFPPVGHPLDYDELGRRLQVSSSTVRRIEQRALARLRGLLAESGPMAA